MWYGASVRGSLHERLGYPCQDAHAAREGVGGIVAAAVADGVGAAPRSDVGAQLAARTAVAYCVGNLIPGMQADAVRFVMRTAFDRADTAILDQAIHDGNPRSQYNTTLCVAVCMDGAVHWGQAGDSGMVARLSDGRWTCVTRQQRDEAGRVYALWWGADKWEFGTVRGASDVILLTDGMLAQVCPPEQADGGAGTQVDAALADRILALGAPDGRESGPRAPGPADSGSTDSGSTPEERARSFLSGYPASAVTDDKTVLVVAGLR